MAGFIYPDWGSSKVTVTNKTYLRQKIPCHCPPVCSAPSEPTNHIHRLIIYVPPVLPRGRVWASREVGTRRIRECKEGEGQLVGPHERKDVGGWVNNSFLVFLFAWETIVANVGHKDCLARQGHELEDEDVRVLRANWEAVERNLGRAGDEGGVWNNEVLVEWSMWGWWFIFCVAFCDFLDEHPEIFPRYGRFSRLNLLFLFLLFARGFFLLFISFFPIYVFYLAKHLDRWVFFLSHSASFGIGTRVRVRGLVFLIPYFFGLFIFIFSSTFLLFSLELSSLSLDK